MPANHAQWEHKNNWYKFEGSTSRFQHHPNAHLSIAEKDCEQCSAMDRWTWFAGLAGNFYLRSLNISSSASGVGATISMIFKNPRNCSTVLLLLLRLLWNWPMEESLDAGQRWTSFDAGWAEGSKEKEGRLHRADPRLGGDGEVFAAGLGSVKEVFFNLSAWTMVSILQKLTSVLKSISAGTSCIGLSWSSLYILSSWFCKDIFKNKNLLNVSEQSVSKSLIQKGYLVLW